ncbi:roadblock/LC7 domain-containing protein [Streptomyces sp. ALI-76-A]|uniref:roadblock/LC7 domain-containing protein n=1 Tax=Streptomyces sp. ALI-76-A TaxID=3025736 RepID=UPI00256F4A55|nr:roadblock/LC7 domain-containing protein [Streptomyces sp. ALI-76-A]MDL5199772.1 roadblock/LC7 domain-containing protein [Streptomyces sp. ALI-76-A]
MTTQQNDLTWLLTDFVDRTKGAVSALVTSRDGMKVASLNHDAKGEADTLSAITSGLHSLADGAGRLLNGAGGVRQVVVELDGGHLFVMAAGAGALLTVLVNADGDVGQVSYEMTLLVKRVYDHLTVAPRSVPAEADTAVQ